MTTVNGAARAAWPAAGRLIGNRTLSNSRPKVGYGPASCNFADRRVPDKRTLSRCMQIFCVAIVKHLMHVRRCATGLSITPERHPNVDQLFDTVTKSTFIQKNFRGPHHCRLPPLRLNKRRLPQSQRRLQAWYVSYNPSLSVWQTCTRTCATVGAQKS